MRRLLFTVCSVACWMPLWATADDQNQIRHVPDQEILDELKSAPRENVARVERLRELYIQAGARPQDIRLQEVRGRKPDDPLLHNVIVTKQGTTESVIVVGGHLDKVPPGDGIIDDWSGACLASNLYQTMRDRPTAHTFIFIGFAYEEQGLVGSRAYVDSLNQDERKKIRAMLNLECLGVDDPFIWTNGSTDSLELIAHEVAEKHNLPLRDHQIIGVGADSIPFDRVGIPNITFDGMAVENFKFIHSELDKFENVKPEAYLNAYRVASRFLVTLDEKLAANPNLLVALDPNTAKRVSEYVEAERVKAHIPGLSVAVVLDGTVLFAEGFGLANVELDVPATADTVYQIGSITKQFTATAVMALVEEEKLGLDDPISNYIENTPESWKDVTVRHLLNHTSGIKSYTNVPANMAKVRLDRPRDEIIATVRDLPLEFNPGEKWSYNNSGYFLLGMIIEKVSGKKYADFLQERIFAPLEMNATRVNALHEIVKNRATGYEWTATLHNAEHASMTWPFSAGALVSTVKDLARWDAALYKDCVLKRASLDLMWTRTKLASDEQVNYGFGWGIDDYRGHKIVSHGGGIPGFTTDIVRFINDKLTVIVLTNLSGMTAKPSRIARGVAEIYLPDLKQETIDDQEPAVTDFFKKIVQDTIDGQLDRDLFTPKMQETVFPDRVNDAARFLKSLGVQKSFDLVEKKEGPDGQKAFQYRIAFGSQAVMLTGTLDKEGKIAGLLIKPE